MPKRRARNFRSISSSCMTTSEEMVFFESTKFQIFSCPSWYWQWIHNWGLVGVRKYFRLRARQCSREWFFCTNKDENVSLSLLFDIVEGNNVQKGTIAMILIDGLHRRKAVCIVSLSGRQYRWAGSESHIVQIQSIYGLVIFQTEAVKLDKMWNASPVNVSWGFHLVLKCLFWGTMQEILSWTTKWPFWPPFLRTSSMDRFLLSSGWFQSAQRTRCTCMSKKLNWGVRSRSLCSRAAPKLSYSVTYWYRKSPWQTQLSAGRADGLYLVKATSLTGENTHKNVQSHSYVPSFYSLAYLYLQELRVMYNSILSHDYNTFSDLMGLEIQKMMKIRTSAQKQLKIYKRPAQYKTQRTWTLPGRKRPNPCWRRIRLNVTAALLWNMLERQMRNSWGRAEDSITFFFVVT